MSPTFFHQSFPSIRRLQVSFADGSPSLYVVDYMAAQWVDTSLLPPESDFSLAVRSVHYSMLTSHLAKHGVSLEQAYESPTARQAGFTYTVQWLHNEEYPQGEIEIQCGGRGGHMAHRLGMPAIAGLEYVNTAVAEAEMLLWRAGNGHIAA